MASAPAWAATRASSRQVTPQIFTRNMAGNERGVELADAIHSLTANPHWFVAEVARLQAPDFRPSCRRTRILANWATSEPLVAPADLLPLTVSQGTLYDNPLVGGHRRFVRLATS